MRLDDLSIEPTRVTFWGPRAALEVRCPAPGVLRLRHVPTFFHTAHEPRTLAPKHSWAVVGTGELPLTVRREEERVVVEAEGLSLEVHLPRGTWSLRDAEGRLLTRCEECTGEATSDYPISRFRSRLALSAPPGEAYLGFGEKTGTLDKRGLHFTFWNTDVMPHHPDTDPLYQSIPFFLALREGRAWGCFLDESWRLEVDVAAEDSSLLQWDSTGPELDTYLFAGPEPEAVVRRYTALTGRPPLPPLWSLGAQQSRWGYENAEDIRRVIRGYRAHNLPLDCVYLDIDYMEGYKVWTWDHTRYPDPAALAQEAADEGVRLVPIVDPGVLARPGYPVYDEALEKDFLVRNDRGNVLLGEVWPKPAAFPDFTREEVQRWWGGLHRPFLEAGIFGFWNDMNEPACFNLLNGHETFKINTAPAADLGKVEGITLPHDARHGTRRHLEVHNVYALGMARGSYEGQRALEPERRPFVLTRAGSAGIQRYAAVWTGDNSSYWAHMEMSIPMLLGMGVSGLAFTGVDVPGFLGRATGEMLVRWLQVGTFYPLLRNHSAKGTPPKEPWRFGEPYLSLAREILERRYRLLPTLYTLMHEASESGLPPMRPLALYAPGDAEALQANDEFLFGKDLLVAPVVRPGQTRRMVYLPPGRWLALANLETPGELSTGGQHFLAEAPLGKVPLWLRAGGALALTGPAPHTTTANWSQLTWHVHAGPQVEGRLYEDAGEGYGESRLTRLRGGVTGGRFVLEREVVGALPLERKVEELRVYGLPPPKDVFGVQALRVEQGTLVLTMDAAWRRVEVRFQH